MRPREQTDPLGRVDGDFRVIRGGSHSVQTRLLRSANRTSWVPEAVNERIGFRVVLGEWPKGEKLPLPKPALHAQNVSQARRRSNCRRRTCPSLKDRSPSSKWSRTPLVRRFVAQSQPRHRRMPERRSARGVVFLRR
jgi:hypothetical protein